MVERPQRKVVDFQGHLTPIEEVPDWAWNIPDPATECDPETAAALDPRTVVVLLEKAYEHSEGRVSTTFLRHNLGDVVYVEEARRLGARFTLHGVNGRLPQQPELERPGNPWEVSGGGPGPRAVFVPPAPPAQGEVTVVSRSRLLHQPGETESNR